MCYINGIDVPNVYNVCESIDKFPSVYLTTSAQYIDMRKYQLLRDNEETNHLYDWILSYPTFSKSSYIMLLCTRIIESVGKYQDKFI